MPNAFTNFFRRIRANRRRTNEVVATPYKIPEDDFFTAKLKEVIGNFGAQNSNLVKENSQQSVFDTINKYRKFKGVIENLKKDLETTIKEIYSELEEKNCKKIVTSYSNFLYSNKTLNEHLSKWLFEHAVAVPPVLNSINIILRQTIFDNLQNLDHKFDEEKLKKLEKELRQSNNSSRKDAAISDITKKIINKLPYSYEPKEDESEEEKNLRNKSKENAESFIKEVNKVFPLIISGSAGNEILDIIPDQERIIKIITKHLTKYKEGNLEKFLEKNRLKLKTMNDEVVNFIKDVNSKDIHAPLIKSLEKADILLIIDEVNKSCERKIDEYLKTKAIERIEKKSGKLISDLSGLEIAIIGISLNRKEILKVALEKDSDLSKKIIIEQKNESDKSYKVLIKKGNETEIENYKSNKYLENKKGKILIKSKTQDRIADFLFDNGCIKIIDGVETTKKDALKSRISELLSGPSTDLLVTVGYEKLTNPNQKQQIS